MATRGVQMTLQFVAWDTSANAGKSGDSANFTLEWIKDGSAATPTNAGTVSEPSANAPGVYSLTVTATEADCNIGTIAGKSSTANVSIIPLTIQFERLPDAAPAASGGVPTVDANDAVKVQAGTGTGQLDFTSGVLKANITQLLGTAWLTPAVAGTPDVNVNSYATSKDPWSIIKAASPGASPTAGTVEWLLRLLDADWKIDKTGTPWKIVAYVSGTSTVLLSRDLKDVDGTSLVSTSTVVGQALA